MTSFNFLGENFFHFEIAGIPKDLRAEVWRFLLEQHTLDRTKRTQIEAAPSYRYRTLLKDLTSYQHAILIDLGKKIYTVL